MHQWMLVLSLSDRISNKMNELQLTDSRNHTILASASNWVGSEAKAKFFAAASM